MQITSIPNHSQRPSKDDRSDDDCKFEYFDQYDFETWNAWLVARDIKYKCTMHMSLYSIQVK